MSSEYGRHASCHSKGRLTSRQKGTSTGNKVQFGRYPVNFDLVRFVISTDIYQTLTFKMEKFSYILSNSQMARSSVHLQV